MTTNHRIAGIDLGSKMAGTTVIALHNPLQLFASQKKQDADAFILKTLAANQITKVYLDAPLSLPGIYRGLPNHQDYFYRQGDRMLRAMSPMFLGGLTARAIKLKDQLNAQGIQVFEVYPGPLAKMWELPALGYKKQKVNIAAVCNALRSKLPFSMPDLEAIPDWHHVDALLALAIAYRHEAGESQAYGTPQEGIIWV
ncbi:MAG: hypothetical protein AAGH79_03820 [Bacteroidota bacterium]